MISMKHIFICLLFVASHANSWGQSVGRTEITNLPDGWTLLTKYELKGLSINGGMQNIPMEGGAFLNKSKDMLLIVESTVSGRPGKVNWVSMKCPKTREGYFTNDYSSNQNSRDTQCLVLNTRYADKNYLTTVAAPVALAIEKEGLRFDKGQLIRGWTGGSYGAFVKVYLFKTSAFDIGAASVKSDESGVEQSLIDFGELLQKQIYESTLSLGGKLSLQLLNTVK